MTTQELAYAEIERLVNSFKEMPAAQRKGLNEMQTLGYILPLSNKTPFARSGTIMQIGTVVPLLVREPQYLSKQSRILNNNE